MTNEEILKTNWKIRDLPYIEKMVAIIDESFQVAGIKSPELLMERIQWLGLHCRLNRLYILRCEILKRARKAKIDNIKRIRRTIRKRKQTIEFKKSKEFIDEMKRLGIWEIMENFKIKNKEGMR